ncbi:50S ribosomal protein L22 [candidate division KSB3 bacterium]|uniref:Large ribosomal subunit protein uL22 n=1 Tax=candidate division KSB3 bacterium TaxID=2044937 RepID=A0A9D5JZ21_9BACT|nr:50S ribosomal protein L22 [candidate division KSB3 bacterium]MBD3326994.1 50S ribosomal protein L22 [candidate division KSB3 bacterium]
MMAVKSIGRYVRVSPRKARLVVDMIRGRYVQEALDILRDSPKAVAETIEKLVRVGVSNAVNNEEVADEDALYIKEAYVDQGPTMKRFRPRAMGRATRIRKRTSHITIILDEKP